GSRGPGGAETRRTAALGVVTRFFGVPPASGGIGVGVAALAVAGRCPGAVVFEGDRAASRRLARSSPGGIALPYPHGSGADHRRTSSRWSRPGESGVLLRRQRASAGEPGGRSRRGA